MEGKTVVNITVDPPTPTFTNRARFFRFPSLPPLCPPLLPLPLPLLQGIAGLHSALKPFAEAAHVEEYKGQTLAVDCSSWLYRGAILGKDIEEGMTSRSMYVLV